MSNPEPTLEESSTLRESCVLVDYHGGFYNWLKRDAKASVEYSKTATNDANSYQNYKNIFVGCDGILASMKSVINEARSFHYATTLPAPKSWGTAALISNQLVPMYRQTMTQFQLKLDTLKTHLNSEWSTMLQAASKHLGNAHKASDYPDIDVVLAACYIEIDFRPVPSAKDITHPTLGFLKEAVAQESAAAYDKAITELWQRLLVSVEAAKKNLMKLDPKKDGRFRTEWLQNLRELLPTLKGLNISGDPKFEKLADEASALLRYDEEQLKQSVGKRSELAEEAEALYRKLSFLNPTQEDSK